MGNDSKTLKDRIRQQLLDEGFDAVGFTVPGAVAEAGKALEDFLGLGYHGDMGWMKDRAHHRSHPHNLWPDVRAIVVVASNYGPAEKPDALAERVERQDRATLSVYAQGKDYHDVMKKRLKRVGRELHRTLGAELKVFVDTAPVMEKPLAMAAGLGWQGKHTNLVSRDFGSWLFLGALFLDFDLEPDEKGEDHCGGCTACLASCPTSAFVAPYQIDARRCISYLTIELKGHIPEEFRAPMGNRIYGCDDCLTACPWNKFAVETKELAFTPREDLTAPRLAELATLDDAGFRAFFAGSPIKRIGRDRFLRNTLIALGNSGDRAHIPLLESQLKDPSPLVRAMAVWALRQLTDEDKWSALKAEQMEQEADPDVLREWL